MLKGVIVMKPRIGTGRPLKFFDNDSNIMNSKDGVRALRLWLKISRADFGYILGTSGRTVEGWEQGRAIPENKMLLIQAIYYEIGHCIEEAIKDEG